MFRDLRIKFWYLIKINEINRLNIPTIYRLIVEIGALIIVCTLNDAGTCVPPKLCKCHTFTPCYYIHVLVIFEPIKINL
jgi:hypothetical protein